MERPHRLEDSRQLVGEVGSISGPEGDALTLLSGQDPVAVVLHFMQPARTGGRGCDEGRATRFDETGGRVAPGDTPQHAPVYRAAEGIGNLTHRTEAPRVRYLRFLFHSVSACDPRPSAASRRAWSRDMVRPLTIGAMG